MAISMSHRPPDNQTVPFEHTPSNLSDMYLALPIGDLGWVRAINEDLETTAPTLILFTSHHLTVKRVSRNGEHMQIIFISLTLWLSNFWNLLSGNHISFEMLLQLEEWVCQCHVMQTYE